MKIVRLIAAIGVCYGCASMVNSAPALADVGASPIPADVLARSDTARANMRTIAAAMYTYANDGDHFGLFPPDIRMLYPTYISDPTVFWHPGDSDPAPTGIDTNEPNTPNSTRISYAITSALTPDSMSYGEPVIWDNSTSNNQGFFINQITNDVHFLVKTDPPFITPTPTRAQVAESHLRLLAGAMFTFANDGNQGFPNDPGELLKAGMGTPWMYWNPGDIDPEPTEITSSLPDVPDSSRISFAFPAAGRRVNEVGANDIIVQDNTPGNNGGAGIWVIRGDGRVEFISTCPDLFADADGDGDVDLYDFGILQRCITPPGQRLAEECGCFDRPESPSLPYGDGDVDGADFARFLACFSGPAVVADPVCAH